MTNTEWLAMIGDAAEFTTEQEARLRQLCLDALADGVPSVLVADAAGVSRVTLWRWRQEVTS